MSLAAELEQVGSLQPAEAITKLKNLINKDAPNDADTVKVKEQAIQTLSDLLVKQQDAKALSELLSLLRDFFSVIPKAKTAKIVRSIIDSIAKVPGSTQLQVGGQIPFS